MPEAMQRVCGRKVWADARGKARRMRDAKQGRSPMQGKADAHCKERKMCDARQGVRARNSIADERDKAG
jgi:hypothetical protein